jgi:hypothetical protein
MSDPLSLVASGAAVLGLADVLLRASKELYSFFHELKDASRNVALVLAELDQLGALFASAQQYTNESEASNDCLAIPEVSKALENCRAEFEGLRAWVEKAGVGPGDGRVKRMAKKLKWVVDDAKLSHSRQNLERLKSSLGIALSAAGRSVEFLLHLASAPLIEAIRARWTGLTFSTVCLLILIPPELSMVCHSTYWQTLNSDQAYRKGTFICFITSDTNHTLIDEMI